MSEVASQVHGGMYATAESTPTPQSSFERVVSIVRKINDVYESRYITRSIVVCGFADLETMCLMKSVMERLDYPVEVLTVQHSKEVLARFNATSIRTLIVSELCGALFESLLSFLATHIDVIFVDTDAVADPTWISRTFGEAKIVWL